MIKEQMENIYRTMPAEKIPWNIEAPPEILKQIVSTKKVKPCKAIELGCGTGNYVIYLAGLGFQTTGVDISDAAITMARNSASSKDVECEFISIDVLGTMREIKDTFDFVYDWELLHHIFPEDRENYIKNVYRLLNPGGYYLSVCFSELSPQFGGVGKYRKSPIDTTMYFSSESEIKLLLEPIFDIEELKTVEIAGKYAPHKAVYVFSKKK